MEPATTPAARGQAVLERVRALVPLIAGAADEIARESALPARVIEALRGAGVFHLLVPLEVGGAEADLRSFALIAEAIGKADMSTGWLFVQGATAGVAIAPRIDLAESRAIFGDRRCIVAAGTAMPSARAEAVEGGYRVSGEWAFASGCLHATWFDARTPIWRNGEMLLAPNGMANMHSMLVPRESIRIVESWPVQGMKGTGSHRYVIDDVFVPSGRTAPMWGDTGWGAGGWADGPLYRVSGLGAAHIAFTSVALGAASGALSEFIELAAAKTPAFTHTRIADSGTVQALVGRARARIGAALAFRDTSVARVWDEAEAGRVSAESRADMRLASVGGVDAALEVIDSLYRAAGTSVIFEGSSLQRRFQDIHVLSQQLLGRTAHYETVGKMLLGLEYEKATV